MAGNGLTQQQQFWLCHVEGWTASGLSISAYADRHGFDVLKDLVVSKDAHIAILEEKLRLALHKRFSASSERVHNDQQF